MNKKALVADFDDPQLAIFAKRCARMATCLVNMCPEDPLFGWPTLTEEMERLVSEGRGDEFLQSLDKMKALPKARDQLIRFVGKFPSRSSSFLMTLLY